MSQSTTSSAAHAKDRLYAQLARSLSRMSGAVANTADLCERLQADVDAMRRLAGMHAAQFMTVAANLNEQMESGGGEEEEGGGR